LSNLSAVTNGRPTNYIVGSPRCSNTTSNHISNSIQSVVASSDIVSKKKENSQKIPQIPFEWNLKGFFCYSTILVIWNKILSKWQYCVRTMLYTMTAQCSLSLIIWEKAQTTSFLYSTRSTKKKNPQKIPHISYEWISIGFFFIVGICRTWENGILTTKCVLTTQNVWASAARRLRDVLTTFSWRIVRPLRGRRASVTRTSRGHRAPYICFTITSHIIIK
jgi:hypothetical protein